MKKEKKSKYHDYWRETANIVAAIRRMPGVKIVTLNCPKTFDPIIVIRVSAEGEFGKHFADLAAFEEKLLTAAFHGGTIVVRRFVDETLSVDGCNSAKSVLYAADICGGVVMPLSAEEVGVTYESCTVAGRPLGPEPGVSYGDFAEFFTTDLQMENP